MTDDSLRASDADREATVARLQHAFAEGRLELAEVDERTAAAYAAKTFGDLAALTRDLPAEPPAPARTPQTPRQPSAPPSWAEQHGQDVWRWTQYGLPPVIVISVIVWVAIGLTSHWTHPWWIWIIVAWVCGGVGGRRGRQRRRRDWHDRRDGPGSIRPRRPAGRLTAPHVVWLPPAGHRSAEGHSMAHGRPEPPYGATQGP